MFTSKHTGADVDFYDLTQLNFDVKLVGGWPDHGAQFDVLVEGLDADGRTLWEHEESRSGMDVGEVIHM